MLLNKLAGLSGLRAFGTAFLSGVALGLSQAPFDFPWTLFLVAPVLFAMLQSRLIKGGFWLGWFAGLGYFAFTLHWIVEPFLVDFARTGWMAPFALILMAAGLALFWAVPFAIVAHLGGGLVAFAGLWTLSEFARSTILTGFPWALTGYAWVDTPIAQASAFVGPHGLGFVCICAATLPAVFNWRGTIATGLIVLAAWFGLQTRVPEQTELTDTVVRLIQPNAPQHLKWHPDHIRTYWDRQLEFTQADGDVDLIVWPETAVPYLMGTRPDLDEVISQAAAPAKVVFGATRKEGEGWLNSAALLGVDGQIEAVYDKHHLVPFGEFLPFAAFFERFGLQALAQNAGRFTSGQGPAKIDADLVPEFQILICYEAVFPHEILRGEERPAWLLHITNDAWFGDFSGPYQHLAQARMRSIEFGLPLARSANTGVSAMIDPYGRVTDSLELNSAGYLDVTLPAPIAPTFYARLGDLPVIGAILSTGFWVRDHWATEASESLKTDLSD